MLTKAPIKYFAKVGSGQGAPQRETDFSETGIPFIRAGSLEDLLNGREETDLPKVDEKIAQEYKLKLYQPNTIVFAKSGMSALKVRIYKLKNPCYVVNHLATLELKENAIPDYVIYTLRYFSPVKLINDNAYPSLKQSVIENYEVPFPKDKVDQLHIANLLSKAENLIAQRKDSIRLLDEFLKSTFLEMFGDPVKNEKGWEKVSLGIVCRKIGSGSTPKGGKESYHKEGISLIRSLNVHNDEFVYKDLAFIDDKQAHELRNVIIEENDVLLNITGASVARCCIVPNEILPARVNQHVSIIRPDSNILNPRFLSRMFTSENYQLKLIKDAKSKGATREAITKEELELMKVIAPPIELQTQFTQIVEKTEALKTQYQQSLQELENLYGSLSQKAFRGELEIKKATAD